MTRKDFDTWQEQAFAQAIAKYGKENVCEVTTDGRVHLRGQFYLTSQDTVERWKGTQ